MNITKSLACCGLALLLGACAGQVTVPPVNALSGTSMKPVKGRFAAVVQSGGWNLKVESRGHSCNAWTFDADVNNAYVKSMQDALQGSVEKIEFTPGTLTPQQLRQKGYDAQIVVYQGNAESNFTVTPHFFSATANSDIALALIVAITDQTGLVKQYSVDERGTGVEEIPPFSFKGCSGAVNEAISKAGQAVVQKLVQKAILFTRDGLRDRAENTAAVTR